MFMSIWQMKVQYWHTFCVRNLLIKNIMSSTCWVFDLLEQLVANNRPNTSMIWCCADHGQGFIKSFLLKIAGWGFWQRCLQTTKATELALLSADFMWNYTSEISRQQSRTLLQAHRCLRILKQVLINTMSSEEGKFIPTRLHWLYYRFRDSSLPCC